MRQFYLLPYVIFLLNTPVSSFKVGKRIELLLQKDIQYLRGGASDTSIPLPADQITSNLASHQNETQHPSQQSYYSGPCDILESPLETTSYPICNYTLPDFNEEFHAHHGSNLIHVTSQPLLSSRECEEIITRAKDFFISQNQSSWPTLQSGRFAIAGSYIKDIPPVQDLFDTLLRTKLFPALAQLFPSVIQNVKDLRIQSAYLFQYDPSSGEKTDMHMDSSLLSFTILLNDKEEFEGGGTFYESLGEKGEVVRMEKGCVTFRPGGKFNTNGTAFECQHDRFLLDPIFLVFLFCFS